jgi:hypothetical protein
MPPETILDSSFFRQAPAGAKSSCKYESAIIQNTIGDEFDCS